MDFNIVLFANEKKAVLDKKCSLNYDGWLICSILSIVLLRICGAIVKMACTYR